VDILSVIEKVRSFEWEDEKALKLLVSEGTGKVDPQRCGFPQMERETF
jgi:hypothetical protein